MQHQCIVNAGARQMGNACKPTRRTHHLDIRYFALTEWTDQDLIILKPISTSNNNSEALTKALGRQLFTRHKSTLLGHRKLYKYDLDMASFELS